MKHEPSFNPVDARIIYWTYAVAAWVAGFALQQWGHRWFGLDFPGYPPMSQMAVLRLFAVSIIGAGCFAAALARMEPIARRRARPWFLAANVVVFAMLITQLHAIWGNEPAEYAAELLLVVVVLGVLLGAEESGAIGPDAAQMTTLFGGPPHRSSTRELRTRYEQQIREAAGQEERNRLARELHDSIKQQLFVVQTAAATVQTRWDQDPPGARAALDQVRASARDAMTEMEVMLDQLRATPLENVGLIEALKKQSEALGLRTGAKVSFEAGVMPAPNHVPPGAPQAIFRVAQEALANVARHARASHVRVSIDGDETTMRLVVHDDGVGFESGSAGRGMGLTNMRERADEFDGELVTRSRPGEGTTVTLVIPCRHPERDVEDARGQVNLWAVLLALQVFVSLLDPEASVFAVIPAVLLVRSLRRLRQSRVAEGAQ